MSDPITIKDLTSLSRKEVSEYLSGIYEESPWVSEGLAEKEDLFKSITTVSELAASLRSIVDHASNETKMKLLKAHPDLCEKVGKIQDLSKESQDEQSRAGLQSLTDSELERFTNLNTAYKARFGFPFILAVRNATKFTVLSALGGRVSNPPEKEFAVALEQVHKIAWMRLLSKIDTEESEGFLTCHVLDTANGCPASNMRVVLHKLFPEESAGLIKEFTTNEDGRLEGGPALKGSNFTVGVYEWTFFVADYFASKGTFTSGVPFLDTIPIRFGIDNPDDHYHVPLLVSPWSFSTYRGS